MSRYDRLLKRLSDHNLRFVRGRFGLPRAVPDEEHPNVYEALLARFSNAALWVYSDPDTHLPAANIIWDNLHKLEPFRTWLCKMGRHDYEFVTIEQGGGLLECFYCLHRRLSFRSGGVRPNKLHKFHIPLLPMSAFPKEPLSGSEIILLANRHPTTTLLVYAGGFWLKRRNEGNSVFDLQREQVTMDYIGWGWISGGYDEA